MTALRIAILQHSEYTPAGTCTDWARGRGHKIQFYHLYKGDLLPQPEEFDWLIVLGGPMNVDDVLLHPWLLPEKVLIAQTVACGKTILGLCLGGQLLAQSLGAQVTKNSHWEVGWQSVQLMHPGAPSDLTVFQWHQDHFGLPLGAMRIATNSATLNQAFIYKQNMLGIQFHPESTREWVESCVEDKEFPAPGPYVQPREKILEGLSKLGPMRVWFYDWLRELERRTQDSLVTNSV